MRVTLTATIVADGSVALDWQADSHVRTYHLLIVRTGATRAYTALKLGADTVRYRIDNLSRHQRYLVAVMAAGKNGAALSLWWSMTPQAGLTPLPDNSAAGVDSYLSCLSRVTVMPQDARLTVFWDRTPGFIDTVEVGVACGETALTQIDVEPEVSSLSLDHLRGLPLVNGKAYTVRVGTRFAGSAGQRPVEIIATPAPQGHERAANESHPQTSLIYATLSLAPEVEIFGDTAPPACAAEHPIVCFHCRREVLWQSYQLRCQGCGAEFVPNGRGDFLTLGALRFGTCRCCLPKKILIQKPGSSSLTCAHSGKEHIRLPGSDGYTLIEDLPHGLCQCCRPRRPLVKRSGRIVCSQSGESHRNEQGCYVLVPSAPVFDARAIDDLLDQGLAEICATGASRGRR